MDKERRVYYLWRCIQGIGPPCDGVPHGIRAEFPFSECKVLDCAITATL